MNKYKKHGLKIYYKMKNVDMTVKGVENATRDMETLIGL